MREAVDMTGQKIGRLTVMRRDGSMGRKACWLCMCECGNERTVIGNNLRKGASQSCGCLRALTLRHKFHRRMSQRARCAGKKPQ